MCFNKTNFLQSHDFLENCYYENNVQGHNHLFFYSDILTRWAACRHVLALDDFWLGIVMQDPTGHSRPSIHLLP